MSCEVVDCGTANLWEDATILSIHGKLCLFQIFGSYTLFLLPQQWALVSDRNTSLDS